VIPVLDNDGRVTDVKRDENGNVVRSRLDENLLRMIARRTRGVYFVASRPGGQLPRLLSALGSVARAAKGQRLVERPVARFPWLAAIAVALLAADRLRRYRRRQAVRDETPLHEERTAAAAAVAILMTLVLPAPAPAQSAWTRGDQAFKAGRYAEAESLYALRLKHGGPAAVRVNRATARGLRGGADEASHELASLATRDDRVGRTAGYNLGTLLGERREYEPALAALRRVLERDPVDEDARWNYEVLARRQQERQNSPPTPPPPQPQPQHSGGGGGNQGPSQPQPAPAAPAPTSPGGTPPTPQSGGAMSRSQAEQILNALEEMARMDQQRQHRVRVQQEKRGKDW
jgi:tetratricopeptide (TPR) repeat protein